MTTTRVGIVGAAIFAVGLAAGIGLRSRGPIVPPALAQPSASQAPLTSEEQTVIRVARQVTPAVVSAFRSIGWGWGGDWSGSTKDYMHFSSNGH